MIQILFHIPIDSKIVPVIVKCPFGIDLNRVFEIARTAIETKHTVLSAFGSISGIHVDENHDAVITLYKTPIYCEQMDLNSNFYMRFNVYPKLKPLRKSIVDSMANLKGSEIQKDDRQSREGRRSLDLFTRTYLRGNVHDSRRDLSTISENSDVSNMAAGGSGLGNTPQQTLATTNE